MQNRFSIGDTRGQKDITFYFTGQPDQTQLDAIDRALRDAYVVGTQPLKIRSFDRYVDDVGSGIWEVVIRNMQTGKGQANQQQVEFLAAQILRNLAQGPQQNPPQIP